MDRLEIIFKKRETVDHCPAGCLAAAAANSVKTNTCVLWLVSSGVPSIYLLVYY
jgi:hypothetical protein